MLIHSVDSSKPAFSWYPDCWHTDIASHRDGDIYICYPFAPIRLASSKYSPDDNKNMALGYWLEVGIITINDHVIISTNP